MIILPSFFVSATSRCSFSLRLLTTPTRNALLASFSLARSFFSQTNESIIASLKHSPEFRAFQSADLCRAPLLAMAARRINQLKRFLIHDKNFDILQWIYMTLHSDAFGISLHRYQLSCRRQKSVSARTDSFEDWKSQVFVSN